MTGTITRSLSSEAAQQGAALTPNGFPIESWYRLDCAGMETRWKIVVATLAACLTAFAIWEAARGRWALVASIAIATFAYAVAPRIEAAMEAEPRARAKPSIWRPLREYLWAFVAFWVALAVFVFLRDRLPA